MLYNKNSEKELGKKLFENPTAEYRGTPFWSWNTKLEKDELLFQIEQLKEMGFGGFHMHSRSGMATEYLGTEFMDLVKACNEKAKEENMVTWLYDEDRWPSGFAGGYVTKNPKFRQKYMLFTVNRKEDAVDAETGFETGKPYLLACYDIVLNSDGTLKKGALIDETAETEGTKWYVYVCTPALTGRFNKYCYADTLSPDTIDEFIKVTYEAYKNAVGDEFGKSIFSIFTDEPQFKTKQTLHFASSKSDVSLPFTTDLPDTYTKATGIDFLGMLPELLWDLPDGAPSKARYLYHDHVCERFTQSFSDKCGKWCTDNGIYLTGHVMEEPSLRSQTNALGEAMRTYRSFGIPGIDMLCNNLEYTTAKQCQSAVHQYNREAMLSELYGVAGWDFDFRGHKFQGDWQAALGVTVRVPHLSWVAMKGSAKRDYPASIHYQSSWYKEYPMIENHFSRLNTALTRGKPSVKVGVIHPIESYWLHYGPDENTSAARAQLEQNFQNVTEWLLFGTIDFDFISESLLPEQYEPSGDALLHVGAMQYSAIVVPALETIRKTTLDALEQFSANGGKVIFMGECPKYVDAEASDGAEALYAKSVRSAISETSLLGSLADEREISVITDSGSAAKHLIYNMRDDGECRWLFIAPAKNPSDSTSSVGTQIFIKGEYTPVIYDTLTGKIQAAEYRIENGRTIVRKEFFAHDSLLLKLEKFNGASAVCEAYTKKPYRTVSFKKPVEFALDEPNVLVLDMAKVSKDGVVFSEEPEEILRLEENVRRELGFPLADGYGTQPWTIPEEEITNFRYLKFEFESEVSVPCRLAFEEALEVIFNGENVPVSKDGYFTDKKIYTMPMPNTKIGANELIVKAPIGKSLSIENYFLLGSFGVRVAGCECTVTKLPEKIGFGSVVPQGMPFYGANITYKTEIDVPEECDAEVRAPKYKGALVKVCLDGKEAGSLTFSPYRLKLGKLSAGKHTLEFKLFGTRVNCFNGLHNCSGTKWIGPGFWYSKGDDWAYEYQLKELGIMKSPEITFYK